MEKYPQVHLQKRLATGLGVLGGAKGSLTKSVGRLGNLKRALNFSAGDDINSIPEACDLLERELQLSRVELAKLVFVSQRQQQNIASGGDDAEKRSDSRNIIAEEEKAVQQLRQELRQASATVAAKQEYEQMAKLLISKHPTSTHVLENEIKQLETELEEATQSCNMAKQQMELRQSQFQLLMQCMLDLKQSLKYDKESDLFVPKNAKDEQTVEPPAKKAKQQKPQQQAGLASKPSPAQATTKDAKMQEEDDDEEGALYDDL